jgi:fructoselysine-6-P-deglycase FrlB-like protein
VSAIEREIASQPETWRRAAELAASASPFGEGRVAVIGCGTSYHVAVAVAGLRETAGAGETDAFAASEAPLERPYDRVVAVSRSATTTEVVDALARVAPSTDRVAIVGVAELAVGEAADREIVLGFADEESVVQTRFATTVIALARASLGERLDPAIEDARRALREPLPIDPSAYEHHVFLATGWRVGVALEAALKLREAAQAWCEAYPAMEYRHGPISLAGPHSAVWLIGESPAGLAAELRETGATVVESDLDPLAQLVVAQRAAVALAAARGLDPDHPRHLTRSVVLGRPEAAA